VSDPHDLQTGAIERVLKYCQQIAGLLRPAFERDVATANAELTALLAKLREMEAEPQLMEGLSVICNLCGYLIAGEEAGDKVKWVTCRKCRDSTTSTKTVGR
jgi:hypothetical protein